ncbi:phosphotransferase [[Erwinia] mediterraneensis]|uniref:phosphotransferase n=1 Tax=[Erwinia] mediterraneensis TaxID=2161819 RepID=UPI0010310349|nr:phosphotransferase [[Erwinia] mediterraneensis]
MEQLRTELTLVLGETVSRLEILSEQPLARLYALYDRHNQSMPLVAKYFRHKGHAALEARKLAMLGHAGVITVPAVYGLVLSQQKPPHEVLLMQRIAGVPAQLPAGSVSHWQQLCTAIVEGLLAWHCIDSQGLAGSVDSVQENSWPAWYQQRVEVLWATLSYLRPAILTLEDRQILFRARQQLPRLFRGFNDPAVLIHGNLRLHSILKDVTSDRLLAMTQPGYILWAPREYELCRLGNSTAETNLLQHYLQRAPVDDGFLWRRWLYQLWDCTENLIQGGKFERARFNFARQQLLPWLG